MVCPNCNTESGPSLFCYVCDAYLPSVSGGVKASLPSRFGAFLLDVFVFLTLLLVIGLLAIRGGVNVSNSYADYGYDSYQGFSLETFSIIFLGGGITYFLLFFWLLAQGQTPGKWLMDIRAVDKRNGFKPGLGRMLFRETLGKWVSGCFLGLGWFWAIWDRDAQTWHDKIARTVVLYRRTQSRKFLFLYCLFGALILSAGCIWASLIPQTRPQGPGREVAAVRVPFVGCNSDGQSGPVTAPKGAEKVVQMDATAARRLAYYEGAGIGVLAPRGWYCFGTYGSESSNLFVTPQPIKGDDLLSPTWGGFTGPAIQASMISGDTSGRFEVAQILARVFPMQRAFVQRVIEEGIEPASDFPFGPYPNDKLIFESDWIVEYQTPPHSGGLGTMGSLAGC